MSQYRAHATAIRSHEALVEALVDRARSWARQCHRSEAEAEAQLRAAVELHIGAPVALGRTYGAATTAVHATEAPPVELLLRQPHCRELLGCAQWEDVGFSKASDGTYQAHMSSHDWWWQQGGEARFLQVAQAHEALREAQLAGYDVQLTEQDGLLQLVCESY
jgi:hypothetical protein